MGYRIIISYALLLISKKLCGAKVISQILANLRKQKLAIIKLNNQKKTIFDHLGIIFTKKLYPVENRKNEDHHRILQNSISLVPIIILNK